MELKNLKVKVKNDLMDPASIEIITTTEPDGTTVIQIIDPPEKEPMFIGEANIGATAKIDGVEYLIMEHSEDSETTMIMLKNPVNCVNFGNLKYMGSEFRNLVLNSSSLSFSDDIVNKVTPIDTIDYKSTEFCSDGIFIPTYDMYRKWVTDPTESIDLRCNFSWWLSNPVISKTYHLGVAPNSEIGVYGVNEKLGMRYCCWVKNSKIVQASTE